MENRRLPILGNDDDTADRQYIKHFVFDDNTDLGKRHGLDYAEAFHYIGPPEPAVEDYIRENAVAL